MAKLHGNRLIFKVATIDAFTDVTVSVCLDGIYKAQGERNIFEHGRGDSPWPLSHEECESVDSILFGGA
jgi:hypothetical protein